MFTDYHAKLFALELTRQRPSCDMHRLASVLMGARVDLNPHQVDAALFAFRSPLSKGALLADEVGLGKTIEAGLVLAQKWAERKRAILIVTPASLRTQWQQELFDKFALPSAIIDKALFDAVQRAGISNPFISDKIVIASYDFAKKKAELLQRVHWDSVVIDEAHRLRNVHKKGASVAKELKKALSHAPKLLLTATPLQNSLEELYGLVSFIDEHIFCDIRTFRRQYSHLDEHGFTDLKKRLAPVCKRTLRRQVLEYVRYTERRAHTQDFTLSEAEENLYAQVSGFLQRDNLWSLPAGRRGLLVLVLRKLLASSSFAIAGALRTMMERLEYVLHNYQSYMQSQQYPNEAPDQPANVSLDALASDFDGLMVREDTPLWGTPGVTIPTPEEEKAIRTEMLSLQGLLGMAESIRDNAKGQALLQALDTAFRMAGELGGAEKAIIFTESRRTQDYLFWLLTQNGYHNRIVLFNGSNNDTRATTILREWRERWPERSTGSRDVDMRTALVERFRDDAQIMIATEAASEGINLQFCSLVINYDLPWNPQRIEQRIGRCHRYGQKSDVVVVNFLNRNNAADKRVFELLSEKFQLFSGIFGASDEILGSIESGVDFEQRIADIYQSCRTQEEIQASFDALQASLSQEIDAELFTARQKLLEHFDAEVAEKLQVYKAETAAALDRFGAMLWKTSGHVLADCAVFDDASLSFTLNTSPLRHVVAGPYALSREAGAYGMGHPLAAWVLQQASGLATPPVLLRFNLSGSGRNMAALDGLAGKSGVLAVRRLTVQALEPEEHLVCAGITHDGKALDDEQVWRLFDLDAESTGDAVKASGVSTELTSLLEARQADVLAAIAERNGKVFEEEMDKLDRWADERKTSLEMQITEMDRAIRDAKTEARRATTLEAKVDIQRRVKVLEGKRNDMRKRLFDAQDAVENQKDGLLDGIESHMRQIVQADEVFCVGFEVA